MKEAKGANVLEDRLGDTHVLALKYEEGVTILIGTILDRNFGESNIQSKVEGIACIISQAAKDHWTIIIW